MAMGAAKPRRIKGIGLQLFYHYKGRSKWAPPDVSTCHVLEAYRIRYMWTRRVWNVSDFFNDQEIVIKKYFVEP